MITKPILPPVVLAIILALLFAGVLVSIIRRKNSLIKKLLSAFRNFMIFALIFVILLRPMNRRFDMDLELKNIDVLFVVDTTISMWATDYGNGRTRIRGVSDNAAYIMQELSGSNFGLIRFDNRSQILAPFTQDMDNVDDAFATLREPDRYYARGSSPNVVYDDLEKMLISSSEKEDRMTVLFFITDGEITSDDETLRSFAELSQYVDGGAVLGYGTKDGATMQDANGTIRDPDTGSNAISRIDEDNLRKIAEDLDIDYIHMMDDKNVTYLLETIKSGSVSYVGSEDAYIYDDTYFWYVIPLVALLLWEMVVILREGRL
ncbi:MAG: VWA domain-containing protein [Lachnospiraceae bacterium]|nr:VWA domain-containing protein [Lachnospiraceae bacterium]